MRYAACTLLFSWIYASPLVAAPPDYSQAQYLFTGKLDDVQWGPVANSLPPIYTATLTVTPKKVMRGEVTVGKALQLSYSARQMQRPKLPVGEEVLVIAAHQRGRMVAHSVQPATKDVVSQAGLSGSLPAGWSVGWGKPISPWSELGENAFPKTEAPDTALRCSTTGRPAFLAGNGIAISVAPVPPKKNIKWTNPDGDGQFTITVRNTTDKPLTVPALLHDAASPDKPILWDHSLLILTQDKARLLPGTKALAEDMQPEPTVLKPNQEVSTVVNALLLSDIEWPRGGYRVNFQFCLGELSAHQSMYYMSRHHDAIRNKAVEAAQKK